MTEIILHHYPLSPHSEKIRLLFGLKRLTWHSVEVPVMTPRPKLSPMTGPFRRIPIMQIGADFYCDSFLIAEKIEQLCPDPSIYATRAAGIEKALSRWIERSIFVDAVCLTLGDLGERAPTELITERKSFFEIDLDPRKLRAERDKYRQRVSGLLLG
jgi:glutathione S-transferase